MAVAREKAEWILAHHVPAPLSKETSRDLGRLAAEARNA
jgi:hypothetical protein